MTLRRVLAAVVLVALLGACSSGPEPRAERDLRDRVAAVRAAAESGDQDATRQRLHQLINAVNTWRSQGAIDAGYASSILTAASAVDAQVGLLPSPVATSPAPVSESPSKIPPGHQEGHGQGNDEHGNGKGHD